MRFRTFTTVLTLLVASCLAQTESKIVEPDAIGLIFSVDPATQELKRLPSEDWRKFSASSFGTRKLTESVEIVGESASSFRLPRGDKALFVFGNVGNAVMKVKLFECTMKNGRREFVVSLTQGHDNTINNGVPATLARYGDSSYKLTPDQPLPPGEYAITFNNKVFTFGVDAAK